MNTNVEINSFILDAKIKDSIYSSLVSDKDTKSSNNEQKKKPTNIVSLRNKHSSSAVNNSDTSLENSDIK